MSAHFTVRCEACEVDGPDIRRSAGQIGFVKKGVFEEGSNEWAAFLIAHDYHDMTLRRNG